MYHWVYNIWKCNMFDCNNTRRQLKENLYWAKEITEDGNWNIQVQRKIFRNKKVNTTKAVNIYQLLFLSQLLEETYNFKK